MDTENLYFIGIGGMGMAPLAIYLRQKGHQVTGSDRAIRPLVLVEIERRGVSLDQGEHLPDDTSGVVCSSAVRDDHPLMREARRRGLPVWRRGERLALEAQGRRLLAVAGSHGKTTTCAWLIHLLRTVYLDFGYVLGGLFSENGPPPARYSDSPWLIAEIDESDGTIEGYAPEASLIVNTSWDHPDQYPGRHDALSAFQRLAARSRARVFAPRGSGLDEAALAGRLDYLPAVAGADPALLGDWNTWFGDLALARLNAENFEAARVAYHWLSGREELPSAVRFPGLWRRQNTLFDDGHLILIEDYAHHPEEVGRLLDAYEVEASASTSARPVAVVFEPHRYTRLRAFGEAFAAQLARADSVYLLPVYSAGEDRLEGTDRESFARICRRLGVDPKLPDTADVLADRIHKETPAEGMRVFFLGAGRIHEWASAAARRLASEWPNQAEAPGWWDALREGTGAESRMRVDEPLGPKSTLRVGGAARYYIEPAVPADLALTLETVKQAALPWFVLGRGSNLVVPDEGFDGLVIRLVGGPWECVAECEGGLIEVGAGVRLKRLSGFAASLGLDGFGFMEGIPGVVGGSLRMNAGAMGSWVFDIVEGVEILTLSGEVRIMPRQWFHPAYRDCPELHDAVVLRAWFRPTGRKETEAVRRECGEYASRRMATQPREPSAGCVFKNPSGDSAGRLVDSLGLKGRRTGGACVSGVHGNFIVNTGGATANDVLTLAREVHHTVAREAGVVLEPEAILLGRDWSSVLDAEVFEAPQPPGRSPYDG